MKISLTYQESFIIASALSELFEEKMGGKLAAILFRFTRPFKFLVEEYNQGIEAIRKPVDDSEIEKKRYEDEIALFNNSIFIEVEKINLSDLEELNLKPLTLVKLEKALIF